MAFRWGVMGAGNIAVKFVDALRRTKEGVAVAIASRDQARADAFARQHGIPAAYGSYEAMLLQEKPDAVYIAARTSQHAALTQLCIAHGVPVLCEKAMFMDGATARQTMALAREKGIFVMEAMWSRLLPAVQEMKRQLDAGAIGDALYAEFAIGWKAPDGPGNRFFDPAEGGAGCDLLVYCYELADYFLGAPDETAAVRVVRDARGTDVTEAVLLTWQRRQPPCMAMLSATLLAPLEERAVIHGTRGKLYMPRPHMAEEFTLTRADGTTTHWQDTDTVNGFVYEAEEAMRCIRAGLTESPAVPHGLTIRFAELLDQLAAQ